MGPVAAFAHSPVAARARRRHEPLRRHRHPHRQVQVSLGLARRPHRGALTDSSSLSVCQLIGIKCLLVLVAAKREHVDGNRRITEARIIDGTRGQKQSFWTAPLGFLYGLCVCKRMVNSPKTIYAKVNGASQRFDLAIFQTCGVCVRNDLHAYN